MEGSRYISAHESLYVNELIYLGHGCPVWEPNPDILYDRVRIGDVGYFEEGRFLPLFNVLRPESSDGDRRLPFPQPNFPPLRLRGNPTTHRRNPIGAGVHGLESSLTFSISGGLDSPGSVVHGETSLSFTNEKGAALILPYEAEREDIINKWPFKKHMLDNYSKWDTFAETECELEKGTRLILVTGCDLTRQWATATYCRTNRDIAVGGGGGVPSVASARFSLTAGWSSNQAMNTRKGPPQVQDQQLRQDQGETENHSEPPVNNQCVFLRGFYIKVRFLLGPKVMKAAAGYDDPGKRGPEEKEAESLLANVTVESFSPPTQDESLIVVLLDYMLEESDADLVIAHDSDLLPYLQGEASCENLRETLKKMSPRVEVEDGVGSLVRRAGEEEISLRPVSILGSSGNQPISGGNFSEGLPEGNQPISGEIFRKGPPDAPALNFGAVVTIASHSSPARQSRKYVDRLLSLFSLARVTQFDREPKKAKLNSIGFDESLYLNELIYLGYGRPVWQPDPETLYDCVRIGDVGYFRNGQFVPIFNVLPPDNSNPGRRLPFPKPNFPPLRLPGFIPTWIPPIRAGVYGLEGDPRLFRSYEPEEISLSFTNEEGAALILPYEAEREEIVDDIQLFEKHILDNYRTWGDFAEKECELEKGTRLILVTGCALTRQWAMVTYGRTNRNVALGGGGGVPPVASARYSLNTGWSRNSLMNTRCGPPQLQIPMVLNRDQEETGNRSEPPVNNQCVFLRGLYIKEQFLLGNEVMHL